MRSLAWLLVPLLLMSLVPAGQAAGSCTYHSVEGEVTVLTCDRAHNGVFDDHQVKVSETGTDIRAHAYQERQRDPRPIHAGFLVASGYPVAPVVWTDVDAKDNGADGDLERLVVSAGVLSGAPGGGATVFLFADDSNDDGLFTNPFARACAGAVGTGQCVVVVLPRSVDFPGLPSPWELKLPEDPAKNLPRPVTP